MTKTLTLDEEREEALKQLVGRIYVDDRQHIFLRIEGVEHESVTVTKLYPRFGNSWNGPIILDRDISTLPNYCSQDYRRATPKEVMFFEGIEKKVQAGELTPQSAFIA